MKMKNNILKIMVSILLILSMGANVSAASIEKIIVKELSHISEEVFDGYDGIETTVSGKVGYNYALNVPGKNHSILFGFTPNNESSYKIATGWNLKLAYISMNNDEGSYHSKNGFEYSIAKNNGSFQIINFVSNHILVSNSKDDGYMLEKSYGEKEYFSKDGLLTKSIDELGNSTEYLYTPEGKIYQIIYSDGSSLLFNRSGQNIDINYENGDSSETIATLTVDTSSSMLEKLIEICDSEGTRNFDYTLKDKSLLLSFCSNKNNKKTITYENSRVYKFAIPRIKTLTTVYDDGSTEYRHYNYNNSNRIEKIIDGDFAEITYTYEIDSNGNMIKDTIKTVKNNTTFTSETINKSGQTTKYIKDGTKLELKYSNFDKVVEEIENGEAIKYSYTEQGKVSKIKYANNDEIKYDYYPNGTIKEISTDVEELKFTPEGTLTNQVLGDLPDVNTSAQKSMTLASSSGIYVIYNIDSNSGVTNFHTYYGLTLDKFNCYGFAIARYSDRINPGYYSNRAYTSSSLSAIKLNVEKDQESLGRYIYDSSVSASIPAHSWKIALRHRVNGDYHFMSISNTSGAPWRHKPGIGDVIELLNGKTPSSITWDAYAYNYWGELVVATAGYYNSAIHYMIIRD